MKNLLVILGPTATGKTDLGINIAKKYNGEIISCDSRQVYKGLDIGTGKESQKSKIKNQKFNNYWIMGGVKVWMYDVVSPTKQYNVSDYIYKAERIIDEILTAGKLPILVGGSGLYLKALIEGLDFTNKPVDQAKRAQLLKLSLTELQKRLQQLSNEKWESLNNSERNNARRLLRSIELVSMYGYDEKIQKSKIKSQKYNLLKIGLKAPIDELRRRINLRLGFRIKQGMIKEAEKLYKNGLSLKRMKELGLEYGGLADYLDKEISKKELIQKLEFKIGQYAKRQLTWFKKEKDIIWFDISNQDYLTKVEKEVDRWYNSVYAAQD